MGFGFFALIFCLREEKEGFLVLVVFVSLSLFVGLRVLGLILGFLFFVFF